MPDEGVRCRGSWAYDAARRGGWRPGMRTSAAGFRGEAPMSGTLSWQAGKLERNMPHLGGDIKETLTADKRTCLAASPSSDFPC